jgi:hypothetical protein
LSYIACQTGEQIKKKKVQGKSSPESRRRDDDA